MKIILSTRNPSKAEQIKEIFVGLPISILTLAEANISGEAVEDGKTLEENALIKARYAFQHCQGGYWTIADDTGLFIKALNGQPGVRSARWAGDVPTEEITKFTLNKLIGCPDRTAYFETIVALISPKGEEHIFTGRIEGIILESARVPPQPKMPYSPLFQPAGSSKVWAEMTTKEENEISHRGKAFRQVRDYLKSQIS